MKPIRLILSILTSFMFFLGTSLSQELGNVTLNPIQNPQAKSDSINAKRLLIEFEKLRPKYLKMIKDSLSKAMIRDKAIPKLYDKINLDNLEYVIAPYLCISERAINKDLSKEILEYLDFDTLHFRARAFVYDRGNFARSRQLLFYCDQLPYFFHVAYLEKEKEYYLDVAINDKDKLNDLNRITGWGNYKCDLLFSVCGAFHSLWTLKHNQIEVFSTHNLIKPTTYYQYINGDAKLESFNSIIHKKGGFTEFNDTNKLYLGIIACDKNCTEICKAYENYRMYCQKIILNFINIKEALNLQNPVLVHTKNDFCGSIQDHELIIKGFVHWNDESYLLRLANPSPFGIPVLHSVDYFYPNFGFIIKPTEK